MFEGLAYAATLAWCLLVLWAAARAQFGWLLQKGRLNGLLAVSVCQFVLWQIRVVIPGTEMHLLGATVMTLMFGWEFALLGGTVALGLDILRQHWSLVNLGLMGWVLVAIPVLSAYLVARLVERVFPRNFFIYVYATAYAGGALSMLAHGAAMIFLLPAATIFDGTARILPYVLLMFGEGFLSAGLLTLLVAYRPEWVVSFKDSLYVNGR
jgi:uncharacterized membrane protein